MYTITFLLFYDLSSMVIILFTFYFIILNIVFIGEIINRHINETESK